MEDRERLGMIFCFFLCVYLHEMAYYGDGLMELFSRNISLEISKGRTLDMHL